MWWGVERRAQAVERKRAMLVVRRVRKKIMTMGCFSCMR